MASIGQYIENIRSAVFGKDVRESIAAAIEQCYEDATTGDPGDTNLEVIAARGVYNTLSERENAQDASIQSAVTAEARDRNAADSLLTNSINTEIGDRKDADELLRQRIDSEASARANADNNLQTQIDNIVAPTGEAPSEAEVENARIGADGTTYTSLGAAIRGQIDGARTYTANTERNAAQTAKNLAYEERVPYSGIADYYWDVSGTTAVWTQFTPSQSGWYGLPAISVNPGEMYKVTNSQGASHKTRIWAVVDSNYTILAKAEDYYTTTSAVVTDVFTVPESGAYLLITTNNSQAVIDAFGIRRLLMAPTVTDQEIPLAFEKAYYWNIETDKAIKTYFGGSNYRAANPIPVEAGQKFSIYAAQGGTNRARIWTACDDALNIIATADNHPNAAYRTLYFTIPEGATRLLISCFGPDSDAPYATLKRIGTVYDYIEDNPLRGKTVAIIGDSISTNGTTGALANVPEITIEEADVGIQLSAYLTYYDVQGGLSLGGHTFTNSEIGTQVTFTPASADVGKKIGVADNYNSDSCIVWWEVAMQRLGFKPIPVCWSGASMSSHEGGTNEYKTSYAWHDAQIRKCGVRIPGSMDRIAPDVIIIYRGVNDFSHAPYAKLTADYFDGLNWAYPASDAITGGYGYLEAIALTVKKLRAAYPNAQIVLCTLNAFKRVNYSTFPVNNGTDTLPAYNDAIRRAADYFGCITLDFDKDGITFENLYTGGYVTDSSTTPTHPNDVGQRVIGNKAITDLLAKCNAMA